MFRCAIHSPFLWGADKQSVEFIIIILKTSKWNWAGHVARATDNWANEGLFWAPIGKRDRDRPKTRRSVDITRMYGNTW